MKPNNKSDKSKLQFLTVNDIDWIHQFVDTSRLTWKQHVQKSLKTISRGNHLPIKLIKSKNSHMVIGYSIEAINLLKAKMEKHPEYFDNGRMLQQ